MDCNCNKTLYKIKPYSLQFLNSISNFFEIIAFSRIPEFEAKQIIRHLETLWNKTFYKRKSKKVVRKLFSYVLSEDYYFVQLYDEYIPNLNVLL